MILTINELHERFEAFTRDFADNRLTVLEFIAALNDLKLQADESRIPFVFSADDIKIRFTNQITKTDQGDAAANDDNVPWLATLDELDEESSETEYESESSEDSEWVDDDDTEDKEPEAEGNELDSKTEE